jgi:hypothetical protein
MFVICLFKLAQLLPMEENFLLLFRFDNPLESSVEFMKVNIQGAPQARIAWVHPVLLMPLKRAYFQAYFNGKIPYISYTILLELGSCMSIKILLVQFYSIVNAVLQ